MALLCHLANRLGFRIASDQNELYIVSGFNSVGCVQYYDMDTKSVAPVLINNYLPAEGKQFYTCMLAYFTNLETINLSWRCYSGQ